MELKNIKFEKEGYIAIITINRPDVLNALNTETLKELQYVIYQVKEDKNIRTLIITGEGKAFVAGGDIAEMSNFSPEEGYNFSKLGNDTFLDIQNLPIPVIAAVNGYALGGGCELAMSCDIRWASEKAKFGQPEVGLGLIPGFGGTQRLARIVGIGRAKEIIFTGKMISAQEAYEIELVNKVLPADEFLDGVKKLAEEIASNGPFAVRLAKRTINTGINISLEEALKLEEEAFGMVFSSPQAKEGTKAFLEKRKPEW